jgi:CheY-like chemotaxis protein
MTKVLLIEDNTLIREDILEALSFEGFIVIGAADGRTGLQLAQYHLPDLIISDIMMPGLDGYEVYRSLQEDPATASIPVIFMTSHSEQFLRQEGIALSADSYLAKPFEFHTLLKVIQSHLNKSTSSD